MPTTTATHPSGALPTGPWPAPRATRPVAATVSIPGSKSLTNRHLVLAALANGPGVIRGALQSRDTDLMIGALRALGVPIDNAAPGDLRVYPGDLTGPTTIDCGLAGTVMRFMPAVAALATGPILFDGDPQARQRPMGPILDGLRTLGVGVSGAATLPFTIAGTGRVPGGMATIDASTSSQFVSGLLLAGARFDQGLELCHAGPAVPSRPHIDMTVDVLRNAGVQVSVGNDTWQVEPGPIAARDVRIEPDLSNAAPFLAAALVAGGWVRVPGWPATTTQPGALLPGILEAMGGVWHWENGTATVHGTGEVRGIDLDLAEAGELAPTIAALAAVATTPTRLRGIAHLRGHETDRLAALATEIERLGAHATQTPDGLEITPGRLRPATVRTYHDHRMATFAAVIGLRVDVHVENIATTAKTLPGFEQMWLAMLNESY